MASPEAKSKAWKEGCGRFRGLDVEVSCLVLICAREWGLRLEQDPILIQDCKRKTAPTSLSQNTHPEHSMRPPVHRINPISQFTKIKNWRLFCWFCILCDLCFNLNT